MLKWDLLELTSNFFFLKVMKHSNIAETSKTTCASIPK